MKLGSCAKHGDPGRHRVAQLARFHVPRIHAMSSRRPRYKTKAEWAAAQASDMRARATNLRFESSGGSVGRARKKFDQIDGLHREAARFDGMAARFKARGL